MHLQMPNIQASLDERANLMVIAIDHTNDSEAVLLQMTVTCEKTQLTFWQDSGRERTVLPKVLNCLVGVRCLLMVLLQWEELGMHHLAPVFYIAAAIGLFVTYYYDIEKCGDNDTCKL